MGKVILKVVTALADRAEAQSQRLSVLQKFDNRGVVESITNGRAKVRTALGNTVYTPASRIITNSNVVGQRVVLVRPRYTHAFIDGNIRG